MGSFVYAQHTFSGKVISAETGEPIPNAEVWNKTESKKIEDNDDKGQNEEDDFDD